MNHIYPPIICHRDSICNHAFASPNKAKFVATREPQQHIGVQTSIELSYLRLLVR